MHAPFPDDTEGEDDPRTELDEFGDEEDDLDDEEEDVDSDLYDDVDEF